MTESLLREAAPLSSDEWAALDRAVVEAARRVLVGRRILPLYGPLGAAVQTVAVDRLSGPPRAALTLTGEEATASLAAVRRFLPLTLIHADLVVHWRDLEATRRFGLPLETTAAAAAAVRCAHTEDDLIFNGRPDLGLEGLRTVEGRVVEVLSDWALMGNAFRDIVTATQRLAAGGFPGPYAVVTSPALYATLHRVYENTGVLEIEQIRRLAAAGVFVTPALPEPSALVLNVGPEVADLAVGQDLVAAFLESRHLNLVFRVVESVAVRIKQPGAIVSLEPAPPTGTPPPPAV